MIKEIRGTFATCDIFDFSRTIQSKVAPSCDYDRFAWDKSILKEIFINHINVSNEITPTIFWFISIILCCYHFCWRMNLTNFFQKRLRVQLRLTWQSWKLVSSSKFQSYRIGHLILSGKDVIWLWKPSGSSRRWRLEVPICPFEDGQLSCKLLRLTWRYLSQTPFFTESLILSGKDVKISWINESRYVDENIHAAAFENGLFPLCFCPPNWPHNKNSKNFTFYDFLTLCLIVCQF